MDKIKNQEDDLELTTDVSEMSDEEIGKLCDFIKRGDLSKSQDIIIINRDKDFIQAEIIVLFKNELFIRSSKKEKVKFHNETLGIDSDCTLEWDEAVSIKRDSIIAISVSRPALCDCASCNEKRGEGNPPEQAKYFEMEFITANPKTFYVRIYDKEEAIMLQDYFRHWAFGKK